MRKNPFQPRGKYEVSICLGIIVIMLIGTWIPTNLRREHDRCFASLLWFVSDFGEIGLILLATIAGLLLISAVVIFIRLSRSNMVEPNQRIAASRMVYYMAVGFVSLVSRICHPVYAQALTFARDLSFHTLYLKPSAMATSKPQ